MILHGGYLGSRRVVAGGFPTPQTLSLSPLHISSVNPASAVSQI